MELISISETNKKLKGVSSFSLPPIDSCPNHKFCADKCYARKAYRAYPNTTKAYDRNFRVAKENLNNLKDQLINYFDKYKKQYFRIHVSGDFYSQEYLDMWVEICTQYPDISFMAFTKCYSYDYSKKPDNMEIIFSTFENMPSGTSEKLKTKFNKPIAFAGSSNPDETYYLGCIDDCGKCKSCWHLTEQDKGIFFKYH